MKNVYRMAFLFQGFGVLMTLLISFVSQSPDISKLERSDLFAQLSTGIMLTCAGSILWAIAKAADHLRQ